MDGPLVRFETFSEQDEAYLREAQEDFDVPVAYRDTPIGDERVILLEHRGLDGADLAAMARLQTILVFDYGRTTLPINHLDAKAIAVRRIPNLAALGVAEQVFALLLGLKKQVVSGHRAVVGNVWRQDVAEPVHTDQRTYTFNWSGVANLGWLYGETLGIIGFGRIGRAVAQRAQGFGMEVVYQNRRRLSSFEEQRLGVRYAPLDELLRVADAVTLHLPFSDGNEHLLGARELGLMKRSALLINTARGRVVDEQALISALQDRRLAGAGLDVLTYEPPRRENPLLALDNVVLSPHIAGIYSPVARREQFRTALRWARQAGTIGETTSG